MASTATVSGKVGPGNTITSQVFSNVTNVAFQLGGISNLRVNSDSGISYIDISADTTVTATLSSGNLTITVS